MTRTIFAAASIAAMFAATGCGAKFTRSAPEAQAAQQIDEAEDRGAPESALVSARASFEFAQKMETNAQADLDAARAEQKAAETRLATAIANENAKKAEVTQTQGAQTAFKTDGEKVTAREGELQKSGLKKDEVENAETTDAALAKHRVAAAQTNVKNAQSELALARAEREYCQKILKESRTRIDDANERLTMAQRVYRDAAAQARGTEAEALAGQKAVLDMKLRDIGDEADEQQAKTTNKQGEPVEGTPQPASTKKEKTDSGSAVGADRSGSSTGTSSGSSSTGDDKE
jgi:hypothetical protein